MTDAVFATYELSIEQKDFVNRKICVWQTLESRATIIGKFQARLLEKSVLSFNPT
jgi:hypothetical protein